MPEMYASTHMCPSTLMRASLIQAWKLMRASLIQAWKRSNAEFAKHVHCTQQGFILYVYCGGRRRLWAVQAKKLLAGPPDIRVAPFKYERDDDYIYIYIYEARGFATPTPTLHHPTI